LAASGSAFAVAEVHHHLDPPVLLPAGGVVCAVGLLLGATGWRFPHPLVGVAAGRAPWAASQSRTVSARFSLSLLGE
jgi:hypothetical protein